MNMDAFENDPFETEENHDDVFFEGFNDEPVQPEEVQEPVQTQQSGAYHGAGTGYRESPYAKSPYGDFTQSHDYSSQYTQKPQKPKKVRKSHSFGKPLIAGLLAVLLVGSSSAITAVSVSKSMEKQTQKTVTQLNQKIDDLQRQINSVSRTGGSSVSGSPVAYGDGLSPSEVYAQNVASVVGITSTVRSTNFYGQSTTGQATGSGFILSPNGYVATNYHVVEGAAAITVTTHEGDVYEAKLVGYDSSNDVAVLKVDAEELPAVTLGHSDDLIIGDMVVAIGNPLGQLTATQTVGYVSGKNREVTTDNTVINMIQTDAAINSGNSGGPLFNMKGEVVGITSAKYSGTTSSGATIEGISFAIPIDDVINIIDDLQTVGYVTGAYLGVTVQDVDSEIARTYGIPVGAQIVSVVEGGSADRAGVKAKDIVTDLGGYEVTSVNSLTRALRHFKAGDTITITVTRGGQSMDLTITLDEKPQSMSTPENDSSMPDEGSYDEWYDYFDKYFHDRG